MHDLSTLHRDASQATTSGGRFAAYVRGLASRIQNECNNQDFAAIRELAVQAALAADDVALTVEHGWDEAQRRRGVQSEAREARLDSTQRVAPSVDTPIQPRPDAPHAGPTDLQRAPTPETDGTVEARPATGERGQSAPESGGPKAAGAPGTPAEAKETRGEPATSATRPEPAGTHASGRR